MTNSQSVHETVSGGVAQITNALANEWAGRGVSVNAIAPGYMRNCVHGHVLAVDGGWMAQ